MTQKSSKREQRRAQQRRQQTRSKLVWGGLVLGILAIVGYYAWQQASQTRSGEAVEVLGATHITLDSDPGTYNSNPPTSGQHYPQTLDVGFYETNNYQYPQGYLLHNMEHGYVIIWYNCADLSESACSDLKSQIRTVMDDVKNVKVIAYPTDTTDFPVVMTSWGRILNMTTFDAAQARAFYDTNLNKSPEPGAP